MSVARCAKVKGCPPRPGRNRSHGAARPVACLRGMKKADEFVPFVISAASDRTVRATSMVDSGMSTPRSLRIRATIIAAPSDWPPYDRKLAVTESALCWRTSSQISTSARSKSLIGGSKGGSAVSFDSRGVAT